MRSVRMFEIIQLLRAASHPQTAQDIATRLEVSKRTIYRDIASLQATRVPIDGEAGVGYVMRPGYDLPPVNFDIDEAEAITVGLSMIARTGDKGLERAAKRAARKLSDATQLSDTLFSSNWGVKAPGHVDLSGLREAIRSETKIHIQYQNADLMMSERTVLPIALIYYSEVVVLAAWCELRNDFRHFRADRILSCVTQTARFCGQGESLRHNWAETHTGDYRR